MLTPAMAQEVWKSPERPSIEKRPGRCANTVSIPGLTTKQEWLVSKHTHAQPRGVATDRPSGAQRGVCVRLQDSVAAALMHK